MRNLIELEDMPESMLEYLGKMEPSTEASLVEVNGRKVYLVVRPERSACAEPNWTEAKANRRYVLIDKRLDGQIDPMECVELAELNEEYDRHMNRIAPLPIEHAREILKGLEAGRPISELIK